MAGAIWLVLAMAAAQQVSPPDGWACRMAEPLGLGTRIELTQTLVEPGRGDARQVDVVLRPRADRPPLQTLRWYLVGPGDDLSRPSSLALAVPLGKRDGKGRIRVDLGGGQILPISPSSLGPPTDGVATLLIDDPAILASLWAADRWSVSVLDRRGGVAATVVGALPSRAAVEGALRRLSPGLAAMIAAPAGRCDELGPAAGI